MSEDETYMGGRGVIERTHDLSEKVLEKLASGYAGFAISLIITTIGSGFIAQETDFPHPWWLFVASVLVSLLWLAPWMMAIEDLKKHTKRVEEQTRKSGKGWIID